MSGATTTLTKGAAGVLNLTAANTFGGNTTLSAGTIKLSGAGSLGAGTYAGNIALSSGAQLQNSSSTDQTLSGVISGAGHYPWAENPAEFNPTLFGFLDRVAPAK